MEEQDSLTNIDALLLQLALRTQELSLKEDGVKRQIQIYREIVADKRSQIQQTRSRIEKLEEEISERHTLFNHYTDTATSLRATNNLLLQYERTLQSELERRRENYSQDMKMYEERIASYRKVFQDHKAQYCQSPLAQKLMKIQEEIEAIEQRLVACEESILEKEKELRALQDKSPSPLLSEKGLESEPQSPVGFRGQTEIPTEDRAQGEESVHPLPQLNYSQGTMPDGEKEGDGEREEPAELEERCAHKASGEEPASADANRHDTWSGLENGGGPEQSDEPHAQEVDPEVSGVTHATEERENGRREMLSLISVEEETEQGVVYPQTPPGRMKDVSCTPTFSLRTSPGQSPQRYPVPESPAFLFPAGVAPDTSEFSGFGYGFNAHESTHEDTPFSFTSSYFPDEKPSESTSTGFSFEHMVETKADEEFSFSFSSPKSPARTSPREQGGAEDVFPFSFSFGRFQ